MSYRVGGRRSGAARAAAAVWRLVRRRRPRSREGWAAVFLLAAGAGWLAVTLARVALRVLLSAWWPIPLLVAVLACLGWLYVRGRMLAARAAARRRAALCRALPEIDALSPGAFEDLTRDLMVRDGLVARRVGGSGDGCADVIGTHPGSGLKVVVQCKHTVKERNVGVGVIYAVHGTAYPVHGADVAVVVTNGGFSRDARARAEEFRIALIDRAGLERWASGDEGFVEMAGLASRVRGRRYRLRRSPSPRREEDGRTSAPGDLYP
ncbi:restriction endonuclease [Actinomadura parmotrematis]|uniref:Restriction endonuclease n=1 Tax=Actinomadura parmotrematis TaxID=2864039 RepID=A0ABS7FYM9_9ACTN|nr:restriction endonuclease [Actinomadura parmotrematis]MBW8485554.1 restriction endonuclease [Actinomadura parmotrematis]